MRGARISHSGVLSGHSPTVGAVFGRVSSRARVRAGSPYRINYATAINDLLGDRTLRLSATEEVEYPLGQECRGVRVVRRQ
jgi:hypothetical protein